MTVSREKKSGGLALPEAALFLQAQAGCRTCLDHLMATHEGLVHSVVRHQTTLGPLSYAEAVQAGRLGLWNAIRHFDPQRGSTFATFAWPCIMHRIWSEVKAAQRQARRAHHPEMSSRLAGQLMVDEDWLSLRHDILVRLALQRLLTRLPQPLLLIVELYYGLNGSPPSCLRQVGRTVGLSHERVRTLLKEALVWLRHPAHSHELHVLLGRHSVAEYEAADAAVQDWLKKRGGRHGRSMSA